MNFKCPHCGQKTISKKDKMKAIGSNYAVCAHCNGRSSVPNVYYSGLIILLFIVGVTINIPYTSYMFIPTYIILIIVALLIYIYLLPLSKAK